MIELVTYSQCPNGNLRRGSVPTSDKKVACRNLSITGHMLVMSIMSNFQNQDIAASLSC